MHPNAPNPDIFQPSSGITDLGSQLSAAQGFAQNAAPNLGGQLGTANMISQAAAPVAKAGGNKMGVLDVIQGLSGLANTGLGLYSALSQKRPGSNILSGPSGGGLSAPNGASMGGGGGGEKLMGNIPSPQSVQSSQLSQGMLPNDHHFQVLLNLLGVKEG